MSEFNSATMIDVTRPELQASFSGSIAASTGILSVTAYTSGQIVPGMILTASGFDKVVVHSRLTAQAGEIERWQTYRIYAGVYATAANKVLSVSSVWYGSLATLGGSKYLYYGWDGGGTLLLAAVSVDGSGLGTYTISGSTPQDWTEQRRLFVRYLANASQAIPAGTAFVGGDFEALSATTPNDKQGYKAGWLVSAAASCGKGLYFPAGRYLGASNLAGVDVYGASSTGTDSQRTVLQVDYSSVNPWSLNMNARSLTDLYLDGIDPGTAKRIKGCYFWMPDTDTTFTGGISGTTLTVEAVPAGGFISVGQTLSGTGVTSCTVSKCLSGAPGGVGTYQVSVSQTVASGTAIRASINTGAHYFSTDSLAVGATYEITDNVFDLPGVYIALHIVNPKTAAIHRNIFPDRMGATSHVIRVDASDGLAESIEVTRNKVNRANTTGIFAGSNRYAPIRNLVMDWNEVHKNTEEAIAIDGFGNNPSLCPCICNGRLTALTNDADGRLVVSLDQFIYATGTTTRARSPVSTRDLNLTGYVSGDVFTTTASHNGYTAPGSTLKGDGVPDGVVITGIISRPGIGNSGTLFRLNKSFTLGSVGAPVTVKMSDWKKFYFIFSEGTGADGTIVEIYDYDATANTLTLDMFRDASLFTTGANTWAGVHAGFFGGSCSHNRVSGDIKAGLNIDAAYSTGISLYHNVFNFDVGHNEVSGIKDGITVTGGHMLSTYHVLAYHNSVHDNIVANAQANTNGVAIVTQYSGIPQRGNRVTGNTCIRSPVVLTAAEDTICENNILVGDNAKVIRKFSVPTFPRTDI